MEAATGQEVELCLECIEWAKAEKRTFLRQALEVRLGSVASFTPMILGKREQAIYPQAAVCSQDSRLCGSFCPGSQSDWPPKY